jgi:Ion channel
MAEGEQTGPEARYGLLLLTLVVAYLLSAVTHGTWADAVHVALVVMVALLAVRHARLRRRGYLLVIGATLLTAVAAGIGLTSSSRRAEGIADIWNGLILLLTVVVIIDRVVRLERVTAQSIYAALSSYLLIGLMFASFFGALGFLVSGPFFADGQPVNSQTLQYFSFTTLTTLGYGDFTAMGSLGRALAVLEALAGQVFLATLVARLVSAYSGGRRRPPPDE